MELVILQIVIAALLTVIGFFLVRFVILVDRNTDATISLDKSVAGLSQLIESIQDSMLAYEREAETRRKEMQKEIDLLRGRYHSLANRVQVVYLKAGLKGWNIGSVEPETPEKDPGAEF